MYYEYVYLLRADLSAGQIDEIKEKAVGIIEKAGGKVSKIESWGLRNLAYKIKKNKKAHYFHFNVTCESIEGLNELKRVMKINENVLRDLLLKVDALDENQSPLQKEADRSENHSYKKSHHDDRRSSDRKNTEDKKPAQEKETTEESK